MFKWWRSWRRRRLARRPFPTSWTRLVNERLPFASQIANTERARFETHLKVFAWDKVWEGVAGLAITDEIKVVVSGSAARLSRNLHLDVYDAIESVVMYPSHYRHPEPDDGTRSGDGVILGQVNASGAMVLSWDAVQHGIHNPYDGHDTALHELAHVLDLGDGVFDGTPPLGASGHYQTWTQVFSRHYLRLSKHPHRGVLRRYGATNEAEFFAVATEAFFEKPRQLKTKAPDLYEALARFYCLDPENPSSRG